MSSANDPSETCNAHPIHSHRSAVAAAATVSIVDVGLSVEQRAALDALVGDVSIA
jgi:hypothetical protein